MTEIISKEQALKIAKEYLQKNGRDYSSIDDVDSIEHEEKGDVLYGIYEGRIMNVYSVGYGEIWGIEERTMFIIISAESGEVLYSMSPTSWIEELENM